MPGPATPLSAPATSASASRLQTLITDPDHPTKPRVWLTPSPPPQTLA